MSLLDTALRRGRAAALARMTESVDVGLFGDATDPATGDVIRRLVEERYTGPARVKYPLSTVEMASPVGQVVAIQYPMLHLPAGSPRLHDGDEVEIVTSRADDSLVGRRYRIHGQPQAGQTTAHRYPLIELS